MDDMTVAGAALQTRQSDTRDRLSIQAIKRAAQADQALANMLEEQARTAAEAGRNPASGNKRISIYV